MALLPLSHSAHTVYGSTASSHSAQSTSTASFSQCTVYGSTASFSQCTVYSSTASFSQCIVYGSTASFPQCTVYGSTASFPQCTVYGSTASFSQCTVYGSTASFLQCINSLSLSQTPRQIHNQTHSEKNQEPPSPHEGQTLES